MLTPKGEGSLFDLDPAPQEIRPRVGGEVPTRIPYEGDPLPVALEVSVQLRILTLREQGGPSEDDWEKARSMNDLPNQDWEHLLFKSKTPGESSRMFNLLAHVIATLSFCPGGIRIFGRHWEGNRLGNELSI